MSARQVLGLERISRSPAAAVGRIDEACRALASDLVDTMRASPACVGIAAPQIGVAARAFVVDVSGHRKARSCHGELVLFDPEILEAAELELSREGCLSVPSLTGDVVRAGRVVVSGLGLDGERVVVRADAFEARAIQHEIDHLDGLVFLDRLSGPGALHLRRLYRGGPR